MPSRLEWTSVPRWPAPALPAAASYLACWFGREGRVRAEALLSGADPRVPVRTAGFDALWDAEAEAELRRLIGACLTGVRIIVAGPESIVMRAMALARELGASAEELVPVATEEITARSAQRLPATDQEITARSAQRRTQTETETAAGDVSESGSGSGGYVSGVTGRRVFCAQCRHSFDAVAAIGETAHCPGCAAELIVDQRFSRPHAAYFGWPTGLDLHR